MSDVETQAYMSKHHDNVTDDVVRAAIFGFYQKPLYMPAENWFMNTRPEIIRNGSDAHIIAEELRSKLRGDSHAFAPRVEVHVHLGALEEPERDLLLRGQRMGHGRWPKALARCADSGKAERSGRARRVPFVTVLSMRDVTSPLPSRRDSGPRARGAR